MLNLLLIVSPLFFLVCFFFIRTGIVLVVFSMLLSPEIVVGSLGIRPVTLRTEDLLIPILALAWLARLAIRKEYRLLASSPLNTPLFLILGLSVVSTVWGSLKGSVNPLMASFYIFKTAEFFTVYFLALNYARTEKDIRIFLYYVLLTAGIVGIYTLFQVPTVEIFTSRRISAPFEGSVEPATVAGYMAFFLLTLFGLFLYAKKLYAKWIYGFFASVILVPFLYTLNRTSYLALFGGLLFIALIERKRKWIFFLIGFLLLLSPLVLPPSVKERIAFTWTDAVNPGRDLGVDQSFQERIYAFTKMWNSWKTSPLIGWGVTSWSLVDSQYARTLHEIGIIGLGLWLWVFARLFRLSKWLYHSMGNEPLKGMILGYRAGLLAILLHGFGAVTFYIVRIMEPFWFMSGLVVSLYLLRVREELSAAEAS